MGRKISFIVAVFIVFNSCSGYLFAQDTISKEVEALMLKGDYAQAAKECEKILAGRCRSTTKPKLYYLLGTCLLKEARLEEARKNFNIILRKFSRSDFCDEATLSIADSYFLAGEYNQAKKSYEKFIRDFPRSELASIARKQLLECEQGGAYINSYFSVQLGCFGNKRNAEKLRDELIDCGYQAYVLKLPSDNLYRVRVGKFSNRLEAEFLEQRLKDDGYSTKISP